MDSRPLTYPATYTTYEAILWFSEITSDAVPSLVHIEVTYADEGLATC